MTRHLLIALVVLAFGACKRMPSNDCVIDGFRPGIDDQIYFRISSPRGEVTQEEWKSFVNRAVRPHLRHDFRLKASGVWPLEMGGPTKEPSHFLHIAHLPSSSSNATIEGIIAAYIANFGDKNVLRVRLDSCAVFE